MWASWKIIPEQALTQYGSLSFLTNCDYDFKLLDLKNLPTFYHFVLRYWQDYKLLMPGNRIPPEHEIIWNNQNILVDKKPIFYKSWFHYDTVQVQDLLNVNREFLSLVDFKQKFNIDTPITLYQGVINAIPWKRSIDLFTDTAAILNSIVLTEKLWAAEGAIAGKFIVYTAFRINFYCLSLIFHIKYYKRYIFSSRYLAVVPMVIEKLLLKVITPQYSF